jgi:hypothetical protein
MRKPLRLPDAYRFPGFRPEPIVRGCFGDPKARIVSLRRRQKKRRAAAVASPFEAVTTESCVRHAICRAATPAFTWNSKFDGCTAAGAAL